MRTQLVLASLLTLFLSFARAEDFPSPPPGFRTQVLDETDGRINMPLDWSYKSGGTTNGWLWTFAKDRTQNGAYDTGFSIQLFLDVKNAAKSTPEAFALQFLRTKKASAKVVKDCPREEISGYSRQCLETSETLQRGFRTRDFRLLYSVFWSDERDQVIITTFGAPEVDWIKLTDTVKTMSEFQIIGPNLAR
jgi:hypothetical protein